DRAVRVDMIGTVLRVVLDDEDRELLPERAARDRFHDLADAQIVRGDAGFRRADARARALRVVLAERHDHEAPHRPALLHVVELRNEDVDRLIVAAALRTRVGPLLAHVVARVIVVRAIAQARAPDMIPDASGWRFRQRGREARLSATAVLLRPRPLHEV